MPSQRGVSTTVTILAGVIAVLGTSIVFLSGDSLNSFLGQVEWTSTSTDEEGPAASNPQPQDIQTQVQEQSETQTEPDDVSHQVQSFPEHKIECNAFDISGDQPVPHVGEECYTIFNAHTWVNKVSGRMNERTTTAFVIHNTGTKDITISSIKVKDIDVSPSQWFFTKDTSIVKPAVVERVLPVDYTEDIVVIGGGLVIMGTGVIVLEPDQMAIVYLNEAGSLTEGDIGIVVTLQVQAGKIQVEKAVTVVRA